MKMSHPLLLTIVLMTFTLNSEASEAVEDGEDDVLLQSPVIPSVDLSYNESQRLVTEAREDLENVTRTIAMISEDIARSVGRQNEVRPDE